ncbi:MAG: putative lipoprotein [Proteobacteria bacterium]|nr:putative lipoprotein [Pseudomonadota bacterium]
MKRPNKVELAPARRTAGIVALACSAFITGCATDGSMLGNGTSITASDKTRMTKSGFLSDYARLQATPWGEGIECWRAPNLAAKDYDKIMISRIVVSMTPPKDGEKEQTIDPSDLKTLTDYFHGSLDKALKPQIQVVNQAGPGVIVLRIALTHLVPTAVGDSVAGTLIPYAFIAEAGSGVASGRPAGSTPYLGETGMEMQFRDGATGAVLGECRDTEIGRKYAADSKAGAGGAAQTWAGGYLNSFQSWSYAKNAFDKWSLLVGQRIALLRAPQSITK